MDRSSATGFADLGQPYFLNNPQYNVYPDHLHEEEENSENNDENDNFYGYDETDYPINVLPKPSSGTILAQTTTENMRQELENSVPVDNFERDQVLVRSAPQASDMKAINEQKLAELRAKLMANKPNITPGKDRTDDTTSKVNIPSRHERPVITPQSIPELQSMSTPIPSIFKTGKVHQHATPNASVVHTTTHKDTRSAIDDLLAEGQAAATARTKPEQEKDKQASCSKTSAKPNPSLAASDSNKPQGQQSMTEGKKIAASGHNTPTFQPASRRQLHEANNNFSDYQGEQPDDHDDWNGQSAASTYTNDIGPLRPIVEQKNTASSCSLPRKNAKNTQSQSIAMTANKSQQSEQTIDSVLGHTEKSIEGKKPGTNNNRSESDVEIWLEMTGFKDKEYRENRLNTYRRWVQLEERKKALEKDFAELEHQEALSAQTPAAAKYLRAQSTLEMPPPIVSALTSIETARPVALTTTSSTAGTKRPFSPWNDNVEGQRSDKFCRLDTSGRSTRFGAPNHVPTSAESEKSAHDPRQHTDNHLSGYRVRGAVDDISDDYSSRANSRPPSLSPSSGSLARRISYPDRRPSINDGPLSDRYYGSSNFRGRGSSPRGHYARRDYSPQAISSNARVGGRALRKGGYFPHRRNGLK